MLPARFLDILPSHVLFLDLIVLFLNLIVSFFRFYCLILAGGFYNCSMLPTVQPCVYLLTILLSNECFRELALEYGNENWDF